MTVLPEQRSPNSASRAKPVRLDVRQYLTHAVLLVAAFYYMYPFLWMLGSSLKAPGEFFSGGAALLPKVAQWSNYPDAWNQGRFGLYFFNTVLISVVSTALVIIVSAMAGYVLSRQQFPGKTFMWSIVALLFFLPQGYAIVPLFDIVQQLNLLNTHAGLILVLAGGGLVSSTALFAGYFATLPKELEESATVDGASMPVMFFRVALPQTKPMMATVGLFHFMNTWNAFFIPLVLTIGAPKLRTLAVGMQAFVGENSTEWTWVCAGAVISILPILLLFFFLQRYFIDSISGAVKG